METAYDNCHTSFIECVAINHNVPLPLGLYIEEFYVTKATVAATQEITESVPTDAAAEDDTAVVIADQTLKIASAQAKLVVASLQLNDNLNNEV